MKETSRYAVEMENISKIYTLKTKDKAKKRTQFYALKDISFKVPQGDVVGILGTNGSGKSTLSLILAGISDHDGGKMTVHGEQALISINTGLNLQLTGAGKEIFQRYEIAFGLFDFSGAESGHLHC